MTFTGTERSDELMTLHKEKAYIADLHQVYQNLTMMDGAPQPA